MPRPLYIILLSVAAFTLNAQIVFFNNIHNNRISKDSVLSLMEDYELNHPGSSLTAVVINSKIIGDSIIHRIFFEKHSLDSTFQKIKNWRYLDLIGSKINISNVEKLNTDDHISKNKFTLLNIWFTACEPCINEIPFLNSLNNKFQGNINFIALTFEPPGRVNRFLLKTEFDFIHLVNGKNTIQEIDVEAYPMTFLIDENSTVVRVFGPFHKNDLADSPWSWEAKELIKEIKQLTAIPHQN